MNGWIPQSSVGTLQSCWYSENKFALNRGDVLIKQIRQQLVDVISLRAVTHTLPPVCACISPPCHCPEDPAWSPQWHSVQHHGGPSLLPSAAWCSHSHPCHVPLTQTWEPRTWSSPAVHLRQHSVGHSCHSTKSHCWQDISDHDTVVHTKRTIPSTATKSVWIKRLVSAQWHQQDHQHT